jgi:hypothetical protein
MNLYWKMILVVVIILIPTPLLAQYPGQATAVTGQTLGDNPRPHCSGCPGAELRDTELEGNSPRPDYWFDDKHTTSSLAAGPAYRAFLYRLSKKFSYAVGATISPGLDFADGYSLNFMLSVGTMEPGDKSVDTSGRLWSESYLIAGRRIYEGDDVYISLVGGVGITRMSYYEKFYYSENSVNIAMSGYRAGFDFVFQSSRYFDYQFYAAYTYLFNGGGYINQDGLTGDDIAVGLLIRFKSGEPLCSCCAMAFCL